MNGWIEIVWGTEEACRNFLNQNVCSQNKKLYKWENGILYKKIVKNEIKVEKRKKESYTLFD